MYDNLSVLSDNRIAIMVDKCGMCNGLVEGIEYGLAGEEINSLDDLLYKLTKGRDPDFKINFKFINMQCIKHQKAALGSTWKAFSDDELALINKTPIDKIYMALK